MITYSHTICNLKPEVVRRVFRYLVPVLVCQKLHTMLSIDDARSDEVIGDATNAHLGRQWKRTKLTGDLASIGGSGITDEDTGDRAKGLVRMAVTSLGADERAKTLALLHSSTSCMTQCFTANRS